MAREGRLTPMAADFGQGETHNQLLAYAVDYGLVGLLGMLAVFVGPAWLFWRSLRAHERTSAVRSAQRAALMGLVFVVGFFIFGLTVEIFNLKVTAAFYATLVAVLGAFAHPCGSEDAEG